MDATGLDDLNPAASKGARPTSAGHSRQRFKHLADAMAATPPDPAYLAEAQEWQSDAWN